MTTDCRPWYTKDQSYIPPSTPTEPAVAPGFYERRSRSGIHLGGTFFRSKEGSLDNNSIAVQYDSGAGGFYLNVYVDNVLMETFGPVAFDAPDLVALEPPLCILSANAAMRLLVNDISEIIQMPIIDYGGNPGSVEEDDEGELVVVLGTPTWNADNLPTDTIPGDDCAELFSQTLLTGGDGPPTNALDIATIFTGPERTLVILQLTEIILETSDDFGLLVDPPLERKVLQYDGINWVAYIPNTECPLPDPNENIPVYFNI